MSDESKSAWVGPGWVKPLIRRFALLLWKMTGDTAGDMILECEPYLVDPSRVKHIDVGGVHLSSWEFMLANMHACQKVHEEENPGDFLLWRVTYHRIEEEKGEG